MLRILLILLLLPGCAGQRLRPASWCTAPQRLYTPLVLPSLTGSYDLAFVATEGPARGTTALGELHLVERDPADRIIDTAFGTIDPYQLELYFGHATVDLQSVGAVTEGSVGSSTPRAPGVVLRVPKDSSSYKAGLAFGSERNRRDILIFDARFTNAEILEVEPRGFRGTWNSGAGTTTYHAGGFFCARRQS